MSYNAYLLTKYVKKYKGIGLDNLFDETTSFLDKFSKKLDYYVAIDNDGSSQVLEIEKDALSKTIETANIQTLSDLEQEILHSLKIALKNSDKKLDYLRIEWY